MSPALFRTAVRHVRVDEARGDGVHRHVAAGQFHRQARVNELIAPLLAA